MHHADLVNCVRQVEPLTRYGKVNQLVGLVVEAAGPDDVALGEGCWLGDRGGSAVPAEVIGFRRGRVLLMPLGEVEGIRPGTRVFPTRGLMRIPVGRTLRGRIIDGLGRPLDGAGPVSAESWRTVHRAAPEPLSRRRVCAALGTGVRAIDGMVTCGRGQRLGIFAGSGIGKSTLMGMIARNSEADVNVIGLVGERGKEVLDFIEASLGPQGLRRSVVVVATADQPALVRLKAAFVATTIAEYFRDLGQDVMLMMDSLTRVAMAQREIGLAAGEPPTTRGYTPSVFALLPRLLERVGSTSAGSVTGLYTVLVEGDDMDEPIADAARAILDGHMVLSRRLATRGQYPPIDVMASVSRVMRDVVSAAHYRHAQEIKSLLAAYEEAEDLINIGAYARGSNARIDTAVRFIDRINAYLRQDVETSGPFMQHVQQLMELLQDSPSERSPAA